MRCCATEAIAPKIGKLSKIKINKFFLDVKLNSHFLRKLDARNFFCREKFFPEKLWSPQSFSIISSICTVVRKTRRRAKSYFQNMIYSFTTRKRRETVSRLLSSRIVALFLRCIQHLNPHSQWYNSDKSFCLSSISKFNLIIQVF